MAAPFSDLQSKAEAALKAVIEELALGIQNTTGLGAETLTLPRIENTADQGDEDPPHTGNFWLTFTLTIRSDSDSGLTAHRQRAAFVIDEIMKDTLAGTLTSNVSDFTCMGIRNRRVLPQTAEDRTLITQIQFDGLCCPSDFA